MNLATTFRHLLIGRLRWLVASGDERDAEILALRHQILVLQRQINRPRFTDTDRTILAVLSSAFARSQQIMLIVAPRPVIGWHRQLVARRWTYPPTTPRARPPTLAEIPKLVTGSPTRTRPGATGASMANCAASATRSPLPRSGRSCVPPGSARPPNGPVRPGLSSSPPKRKASSRQTSRVSTLRRCAGSTCCSSSRSVRVVCISAGSRRPCAC